MGFIRLYSRSNSRSDLGFLLLLEGSEIWMLHCVFWSDSFGVIVSKHAVQQVQCLLRDKALVHMIYELVPWLLLVNSEYVVVVAVEGHVVLLHIVEKVICAEDLGNLDQLVVVVLALEERLFLENHTRKHAAQ